MGPMTRPPFRVVPMCHRCLWEWSARSYAASRSCVVSAGCRCRCACLLPALCLGWRFVVAVVPLRRAWLWRPRLAYLLRAHAQALALARLDAATEQLVRTPVSSCVLFVDGDASERDGSWTCRARVEAPGGITAGVWLTAPEAVTRGERLRAIGRFSPNGQR